MIHYIMYIIGFELMQNRNCNCSVCQRSQKTDSPVGTVTTADGYFISLLNTAFFKKDVYLFYLAGNVFLLQGGAFVIC